MILVRNLFQRRAEISDKRTADASGVHLPDLYSGILQKSAVYADLTEFILDQDHLLPFQCVHQQLPDQRSFSRTKKS